MALQRFIIFTLAAATMFSMAYALTGTATYYGPPLVPSSCYGYQDKGTMVAAVNSALFNNRAACGQRYTVRCTGPTNAGVPAPCRNGPITVTVVDLCPGCGPDQIDLSQQAFTTIADPSAGRIRIDYSQI